MSGQAQSETPRPPPDRSKRRSRAIRFLLALSLIQLGVLGTLTVRINDIDARTQAISTARSAPAATTAAAPAVPGLKPDELRRIVREELAALRNIESGDAAPSAPPASARAQAATTDQAKVRQQLNGYISRGGRMTSIDVDKFLAMTAELPADQREQMLKEFTRAINTGKIEARL